ncbi:LysM peptidoglycan-binding domain-containing protein [Streptomyces sp. NPDC057621]|uniref:LysM peptidoglycan-binding domain-containing protein n=1 Tax=Streptomyces sp. NPDC057621 TaxID=3346186 RepID=UPI003679FA85
MPHSPALVRHRGSGEPRAVVRGLLALTALTALFGGVPALLLAAGTLPAAVPTLDAAREMLLRPDEDGSGLLATMTVAAWIAWLWLVVPVLIEVIAVLARRTTPRLPGMAAGQRLAGLLLGSIVLATPAAAASAVTPAAAATALHAPPADQATNSQPSVPAPSEASEKTAPAGKVREFTVGAEDTTWWELAEQLLGDGARSTELQRLNPEVPTTATVVPQGTTLRVPGHAGILSETPDSGLRTQFASAVRNAAPDQEGALVTVEPGDSLSRIAAEELHDGNKWPQLFEANRGTPQPDGLPRITDPDLIYPGQQITVPGAAPGQPAHPRQDTDDGSGNRDSAPPREDGAERYPGAAGRGQSTAPSRSATPEATSPAPSESRGPAERPSQSQGVAAGPSSSSSASSAPSSGASAGAAPPTRPASEPPASSPDDQAPRLRLVLGAGALLAAAVTGALATRRMLQRRRRKPGETIAIASETAPAEGQLAAAAESARPSRLDAALRTLAHHLIDGATAPALRAVRIGARSVKVLPDDLTVEAPTPFTAGREGWWALPEDAELLDDGAARGVAPPYPGLVTLGSTDDGDLLLVNLPQLRTLLLDGDPLHITEVCAALALEVGMSPWANEVEIIAIGFGEDLPHLLPTARIAHVRHPAHALRDLSERLLEAHQLPQTRHQPYLLLCASDLDADTAWVFADVIDKAGTVPVALVAPASSTAAHFPEAEVLNASRSEPQPLGYASAEITVQRLEHAAYRQIITALKVSGQPPHAAEGPWKGVPKETVRGHEPAEPTRQAPSPPAATSSSWEADASGEIFPALLAATTGPSGLRLPTARTEHPPAAGSGPGSEVGLPSLAKAPGVDKAGAGDAQEESAQGSPAIEGGEGEAHGPHAPEIQVLGPVKVTGVDSTGHGPRMAQLAALLFFRPGRSADVLCSDMDPIHPWTTSTLNARLQGLRRCLGNDLAGQPYVPRRSSGEAPYRLSPGVRCDWTRFLQLVEHALPLGLEGLPDLENALALVRGRPFGNRPLPWAEPYQQEMTTRIIDVAHAVATHRTEPGPYRDLGAARWAVATGLDVDDTAELLYRNNMRIEAAAGNRSGLHTVIARVQQINHMLDCSLETETEQLISELLGGPSRRSTPL